MGPFGCASLRNSKCGGTKGRRSARSAQLRTEALCLSSARCLYTTLVNSSLSLVRSVIPLRAAYRLLLTATSAKRATVLKLQPDSWQRDRMSHARVSVVVVFVVSYYFFLIW